MVREIWGDWVAVTVSGLESDTSGPDGGLASTEPVFEIDPASTSAWVVVYVAVQVTVAPGANEAMTFELLPQSMAESPLIGSVTVAELSVTLPVFSTA